MGNMVFVEEGKLKEIIGEVITAKIPQPGSINHPEFPAKLANEKELCDFLGIGPATASRWRQKGKIPYVKIGITIRYNLKEVMEALTVKKSV